MAHCDVCPYRTPNYRCSSTEGGAVIEAPYLPAALALWHWRPTVKRQIDSVQGDRSMASFEVRETQSKISVEERLRNMDEKKSSDTQMYVPQQRRYIRNGGRDQERYSNEIQGKWTYS